MPSKSSARLKKRPQQDRARRTRESILQASAHILASRGYESTNTNLIAAKAGVSIGSLYQYFPNKEAIVQSLIEDIYEQDRALVESGLIALRDQSFEKLCSVIVDSLIEVFSSHTELRRVLFYKTPRTKQINKINGIKKYLTEILEENLRVRPDFRNRKNLKMRLFILVNAVEAALYSATLEFGKSLDRKTFSTELTDLVLRYCSPDARND